VVPGSAGRHRGNRRPRARPRKGSELNPVTADLQVERVVKRFGSHAAVEALSFEVARGSFFSILGPSGCGKTTLLRMIAGFSAPDEGDILIGGRSMRGVAPNRRPVNMVFQHLALFPMMSVGENVAYGLTQRGSARAEIERRVGEMLERVGLPGAQAKRVDQLSGGQRQRVAIARSLVLEPTLLLLDEPLGALDLKLREHMKVELKQLQAAFGTTFVYITHDQSEALVLSDHVAVMNRGRFEQLGTPQALYYEPQTPFVAGFVGANNRFAGRVTTVQGDRVTLRSDAGLVLQARAQGRLAAGDAAEAFVRPEVACLARDPAELPADQPRFEARVHSLLFDGASSAVLLRETASGSEIRVALPQTGRFADLRVGEAVSFGFDPQRAVCFAAAPTTTSHADPAHA
jgi:spermidine/putrescine transport system ATP-binding protein